MIWIVEALFKDGSQEVARFTSRAAWNRFMQTHQACDLFPGRPAILVTKELNDSHQLLRSVSPIKDYPVPLPPSPVVEGEQLPFMAPEE